MNWKSVYWKLILGFVLILSIPFITTAALNSASTLLVFFGLVYPFMVAFVIIKQIISILTEGNKE